MWQSPKFQAELTLRRPELESALDQNLRSEAQVIEVDRDARSDFADIEDTSAATQIDIFHKGLFRGRLPAALLQASPQLLEKLARAVIEWLNPAERSTLLQKHFGPGSPALEQVMKEMAGQSPFGTNYFRVLLYKLRNGHFESFYAKEEEITESLDRFLYRQAVSAAQRKAADRLARRQEAVQRTEAVLALRDSLFRPITPLDGLNFDLRSFTTFDSAGEEREEDPEPARSISVITSEKEARSKKTVVKKNVMTIAKSTPEEIADFQAQERARYKVPTKPFVYTTRSGEARTVGSVCKKLMDASVKARDHFLLRNERPSCVTLLSLVRDAACKLPKGYGTRNDICELLKESQYINTEIDEEKMSSVVSGALDRLHYEKDPCVRFDAGRKLWFYLHIGRQEEDFGDSDTESKLVSGKSKNKRVKHA